jgi:hypothetical protein
MSGTRRIKAHRLILLADQALEGPIEGNLIPSVSPTVGLRHVPSKTRYNINPAGITVASLAQASIFDNLGSFTGVLQIYPPVMGSAQIAITQPIVSGGTAVFPNLQYTLINIECSFDMACGAAIAPTPAATDTVASVVFTIQLADNFGIMEVINNKVEVTAFNGGTQQANFNFQRLIPFNSLRTQLDMNMTVSNNMSAVGNTLVLNPGSFVEFIVMD